VILVDTSVWVNHFRSGVDELASLLEEGEVLIHTHILGELACGNLRNRAEVLSLLHNLPRSLEATHDEVMEFIERRQVMARGIGYMDVHLLASTLLTPYASLWTHDKRLARVARDLGVRH